MTEYWMIRGEISLPPIKTDFVQETMPIDFTVDTLFGQIQVVSNDRVINANKHKLKKGLRVDVWGTSMKGQGYPYILADAVMVAGNKKSMILGQPARVRKMPDAMKSRLRDFLPGGDK